MTAAELMVILSKLDPNQPVLIQDFNGFLSGIMQAEPMKTTAGYVALVLTPDDRVATEVAS